MQEEESMITEEQMEASDEDRDEYELSILAALAEADADANAGRVVSHEEAQRRSMAWTS